MKKFYLCSEGVERECQGEKLERMIAGAMACNGPCAKYRPARKNCWGATQKGELVWHCTENGNSHTISRTATRDEIMAELEAGKEVPTSPFMGPSFLSYKEPKELKNPQIVEPEQRTSCWECGGKLNSRGVCVVCDEDNNDF